MTIKINSNIYKILLINEYTYIEFILINKFVKKKFFS